ncbi:MAG: TetR/AcrR family transcriptional regulator [Pseudomonadales bacterium]|nr:TetR/AcrR family transcriptional regulator [Pseudomonadales bacterium]
MTENLSSKDKIKNELVSQLANSSYEKVTITNIANALGMSRRNIYKHYSSKEEILADIAQEKLELFFNIFENYYLDNSAAKWANVIERMLSVIIENQSLVYEIVKDDSNEILFKQLRSAIARALGHVARINGITIKDRGYFEIYTQFLASSSYQITKKWLLNEEQVSIEKIGALYQQLFNDKIIDHLKMCE